MKIRFLASFALVVLASLGGVLADVVKGPDLTATGKVVSAGNASLVLKTDDHGHMIPFVIGTTTERPAGLTAGSRVTIHYRAIGTDQQVADRIVLLEPAAPTALAGTSNGAQANGAQAPASPAQVPASPTQAATESPSPGLSNQPDMELPRTASPIPLVGLLGLAAFLASAFLRALERR
jgi:hypothetical protein